MSSEKKVLSIFCVCLCAQSLQSCPTLCDPMDCSPPESSVYGILQARILEWVAMSPLGDLPNPGIEPVSPVSPALQADSLLQRHRGSPVFQHVFQHKSTLNIDETLLPY